MITVTQFFLASVIIICFSVTATAACCCAISGRCSREEERENGQ